MRTSRVCYLQALDVATSNMFGTQLRISLKLLQIVPNLITFRRRCTSIQGSSQRSVQTPENNPRRITSNVKNNLNILKYFKEYEKGPSGPKAATSYRKKKPDKVPLPDDVEGYEDPSTRLYHTRDGIVVETPVLLVDGYNVCGFWPKLKKHFELGKLEHARQKLTEELVSFSAVRGVKVVVVFDAQLSGLSDHKETMGGIDIIYAATTCADSWIEREVACLVAEGCPKVWVTTSDYVQQQVANGCGAFVWNCRALVVEIIEAKKELKELIHDESAYSTKGKLLEHNLGTEVVNQLLALKQQLKNAEGYAV